MMALTPRHLRRALATGLLSLIAGAVVVLGADQAHAADGVTLTARVAGTDLATTDHGDPARLELNQLDLVEITVVNRSPAPIHIRTVRLSGGAVGLTFFAHETTVELDVAPGATERRAFEIDLSALRGQANGLLPGSMRVLDANRHTVATTAAVWDVRGKLRSVYGFFGLAVFAFTAVATIGPLVDLAKGRLHPDRWRRALRFATPGVSGGLLAAFALSSLRIAAPTQGVWIPCVLVCTALGVATGALTPSPHETVDDEDDDDVRRWVPTERFDLLSAPLTRPLGGEPAPVISEPVAPPVIAAVAQLVTQPLAPTLATTATVATAPPAAAAAVQPSAEPVAPAPATPPVRKPHPLAQYFQNDAAS